MISTESRNKLIQWIRTQSGMEITMKLKKWQKISIAALFWVVVWFVAAAAVGKELLIPSPVVVVSRLGKLIFEKEFWFKTLISLLRVLGGFAAGCLTGVILAITASISGVAQSIISPFIRIIRATPVTSFIMLIMLWIGYSFVPVFIAALLVTPIVFSNLCEGIHETDRQLLEVAKVYKFGKLKTVKTVYIPSVKPYFISAAVTSLGLAWKAGIAAEVLCLPSDAIGREIYYSKLYLETPDLFAWTVVVIIFSILFEKIFEKIVKKGAKKDDENK